jgi:hypothetical protein
MLLFHSSVKFKLKKAIKRCQTKKMSKKRRTKKEKLTAAARHEFLSVNIEPIKLPTSHPKEDIAPLRVNKSINSYTYVVKDVRRTLFVTSVIILINVLFFFILKLRFVSFPGVEF